MVQNLVAEAIHNVVSHNTKEGDFHNKHLYRSSKSDRELNVNSAIGHVTGRRDHPSLTRGMKYSLYSRTFIGASFLENSETKRSGFTLLI